MLHVLRCFCQSESWHSGEQYNTSWHFEHPINFAVEVWHLAHFETDMKRSVETVAMIWDHQLGLMPGINSHFRRKYDFQFGDQFSAAFTVSCCALRGEPPFFGIWGSTPENTRGIILAGVSARVYAIDMKPEIIALL